MALPSDLIATERDLEHRTIRDLARRYRDLASEPKQAERRAAWRAHQVLQRTRPLIYVRGYAWREMAESRVLCRDPELRAVENQLRQALFLDTCGDDSVVEPWVTIEAVRILPEGGFWGVPVPWTHSDQEDGAGVWDPPLKTEADLDRLQAPTHRIDETATAVRLATVQEALDGILPVHVRRGWGMWSCDLSTELGRLRGIEQLMLDMADRPAWLHRLVGFMTDALVALHAQTAAAGDWTANEHTNQCQPYAAGLPDPGHPAAPVGMDRLWYFMASQEFTSVGPRQWEEFLFRYQERIARPFGLVAYGCCEDLTRKLPMLRRLPNLRRIAVSPFANVRACAEAIGTGHVVSYRPSPADMVAYGYDEARIGGILRRDLALLRHNHYDITLKDVETVQGDPERIVKWVALTRRIAEELRG